MAFGAHELLLVVRAQNQAAGLIGRVGRDFRRLQNMRSLEVQRSQQLNRLARNALVQQAQMAKMQSIMSVHGKTRLQHELALSRAYSHQVNIQNRINALEVRRTAIARAEVNLEVQRLRIQQQQLGVEASLEKIELRRQGIMNQIGRVGTTQLRNQLQQQELVRRGYALETQLLERGLARDRARSNKMRAVRAGISGDQLKPFATRETIAQRRITETRMAISEIPGRGRILESVGADLRGNIRQLVGSMGLLRHEEAAAANQARIHAERLKALDIQMASLAARSRAVAGAEQELKIAMAQTAQAIEIENARWTEQLGIVDGIIAQRAALIEEEKVLRAQLAQTDAMMAAQRGERNQTLARGATHLGRVLTATGLIGVAAFGAMGVAAAHFNSEAVSVATQTGNINQSAQEVVNNSVKVQKVITDTMQTIPANSKELTDTLYNIYSSINTTFGGGAKLLKLFGQVWVAGGMRGTIEEVSDALITLANNWQIAGDDMAGFQKLAASTLATVRFGRLNVQQYTETMNQLAPAFHGAHQSIEQMNGALAFLTRILPGTGVTAAGIARMMEQLQRFAAAPKKGFEDLAKEISTADGNLKPLDQVLQILLNRMPELAKSGISLTNFFKEVSGNQGTVQARRALQGFMLLFPEYQDVLKQTSTDQKEFKRSLTAMEASTGVKWAQFTTQMKALALELGAAVVPALLAAVSPLQKLSRWFHGLSDEQQKNIGKWLGYIAVLTLALGVIMSVAGGLALFVMSVRTIGSVLGPLLALTGKNAKSLAALGSEAGAISSTMGTMLGTVGAVITIFIALNKVTGNLTLSIEAMTTALAIFSLRNYAKALFAASAGTRGLGAAMAAARNPTMLEVAAVILLAIELQKALNKVPHWKQFTDWLNDQLGVSKTGDTRLVTTLDQLEAVRKELLKPMPKSNWLKEAMGFAEPRGLGFQNFPVKLSPRLWKQDLNEITNVFQDWSKAVHGQEHITDEFAQTRIHQMFPELDPAQIDLAIATARNRIKKGIRDAQEVGFTEREGPFPKKAVRSMSTQFTTPEFLAAIKQAYKLQQAVEKAPNLAAARLAWLAYKKYTDQITADMTKGQAAMYQELLGMMDQFIKQSQSKFVNPAVLAAAQNVERLGDIAAKNPKNLAAWDAFFKARNALQKKYDSDQLGQADEIISAQKAALEAADDDISKISNAQAIKMARRIDKLHTLAEKAPSTANWQRYYALLKSFQDNTSSAQENLVNSIVDSEQTLADKRVQAAKEAAAKIKETEEKTAEERKRRIEEAQGQIKTATSALMQVYTSALQQYQSQLGTIFSGPFMQSAEMGARQQFGFSARPQDLLRDMQESVGHFKRFQSTIKTLRERGAPEEMIAQIQQLGPEAQKQLSTLLRLAPADFKKYVAMFKTGQDAAKKLAKEDMDRQLKEWLKFGKNVALAIMLGIKSGTPGIENAVIAMVKRAFPGLASRAAGNVGTASDAAAAIGRQAREGGGFTPGIYSPSGKRTGGLLDMPASPPLRYGGRQTQSAGTVHNVTYNVHPKVEGEGLESMLRRSHFYYRNRKGNL